MKSSAKPESGCDCRTFAHSCAHHTGAEAVLQKLERSQVKVFVEVESLPVGKHETALLIELPAGVQLLKMDPEKVTVTVVSGE